MSGHSKWSKIKHQKAGNDANKGLVFTRLGNAITIAVKEGNGNSDPESNFRLRLAIEKAKSANMPKDNIKRALERGTGKGTDNKLEEIIYEGYGPFAVAVLIETLTDNHARTSSLIKNILEKSGGKLGEPGSVGFLFTSIGLITVKTKGTDADRIMMMAIDQGALDVENTDNTIYIYTPREALRKVKENLELNSVRIESAQEIKKADSIIEVDTKENIEKIINLIEKLENLEDVVAVNSNFEIAGDIADYDYKEN